MRLDQPAVLNIVKKDAAHYFFHLADPNQGPRFGAGTLTWEVTVDPSAVETIRQGIERAVDEANRFPDRPGIGVEPFVRWGRGLYDGILVARQAPALRKALDELEAPLLIITDEPDLHWELMTPGDKDGFFCLKQNIGRSLRTSDTTWVSPRNREEWRCLIIANPDGTLPEAAREAQNLRSWLEDKGIRCDYLEGSQATFGAVLEKLLTEYDIIHYAGHATTDALGLHGGAYSRENIRTFVKGNPIVFLNGCVSALAVGGLADAFISAGARVVVGSMFAAPDEGAREFAEKFYQVVLGGQPVGEAMRLARKHVMGTPEWGPAWACFVMYGDPCLRIQLKTDDLQASLAQIDLSRTDFDAASGRVLQRAVAYGTSRGGVDTAHLFAAMVGGENPFLRDRLRAKEVPPEALEDTFQQAFKAMEATPTSSGAASGTIRFSSNTAAILKLAKESAQRSESGKISERSI